MVIKLGTYIRDFYVSNVKKQKQDKTTRTSNIGLHTSSKERVNYRVFKIIRITLYVDVNLEKKH